MSESDQDRRYTSAAEAKEAFREAIRQRARLRVNDWLADSPVGCRGELVEWLIEYDLLFRARAFPGRVDEFVEEFPEQMRELVRARMNGAPPPFTSPNLPPAAATGWNAGSARLADYAFDLSSDGTRDKLGEGGMGIVYSARQKSPARPVAIKFARHPALTGELLLRESGLQASLIHPAIPTVLATGIDEHEGPFLVMERVENADWPEATPRRLYLFAQVSDVLRYVHARGYTHGDLKPNHVRVTADGQVKVMDWGLGRFVADALRISEVTTGPQAPASVTVRGRGTLEYLAPEQADGTAVDPKRTDVFLLGGLLYWVLVGTPLHPDKPQDREGVIRSLGKAGQALSKCRKGHPNLEPYVELAEKCLKVDPKDRFEDASAVFQKLTEIESAQSEREKQALASAEKAKNDLMNSQIRRKRQLWFGSFIAFAVAFGVSLALWWGNSETKRQQNEKSQVLRAVESAEAFMRDGRRLDAARTALAEAESRAVPADLSSRVAAARADLNLLAALEAADDTLFSPAESGSGFVPREEVAAAYSAAFGGYGVNPREDFDAAIARVAGSAIRNRLLVSIDLWHLISLSPDVFRLLQECDGDDFRTSVRRAIHEENRDQLTELGRSPKSSAQPAWFAVLFGQLSSVPSDVRREKLLEAVRAEPDNFRVLMTLGKLRPVNSRTGAAERIRWYQAALAIRPDHLEVLLALGAALHDDGQYAAAEACAQAILDRNPKHVFALNNQGNELLQLGQPERALEVFKLAMTLDPKYATPRNGAGNACRRIGEGLIALGKKRAGEEMLARAEALYGEAIKLDPKYELPWRGLGLVHDLRKEWKQSASCYREALARRPRFAAARTGLANALVELAAGRKEFLNEAIGHYRQGIADDPSLTVSYRGLGNALTILGENREAEMAFRECLRIDPRSANVQNSLGNALFRQGRWIEAKVQYEAALQIDADFVFSLNGLANILLELNKAGDAIPIYRRAIQLQPEYGQPYNGLARALLMKPDRTPADLDEAYRLVERAIDLLPSEPHAYVNLGHYWAAKGNLQIAADSYGMAVCVDQKYENSYVGLGDSLLALDDVAGAESAYVKLLSLNPRHPHAHAGLAVISEKRKDWIEAIIRCRITLVLNPNHEAAKRGLERVLEEQARGKPTAESHSDTRGSCCAVQPPR